MGWGYEEMVRRCGRPSSWWYRATSAATADCRSAAKAARSSGDLNPITVSTVRVGSRVPVAALPAIAPTSDTVRAFTAIRYAAERRSATSFGSRAALCNTSGATTRWRAERRTNRSVIPPQARSSANSTSHGPPTPSGDSSPSAGSNRPPPQPWWPTPVQSARRGSRPGSGRAPAPRRLRLRVLEHRPRASRYALTVNIVKTLILGTREPTALRYRVHHRWTVLEGLTFPLGNRRLLSRSESKEQSCPNRLERATPARH